MKFTGSIFPFKRFKEDVKGLFKFIKPYRKFFYISIFFTLITSSAGLLIPYLTGRGIDLLVVVKNISAAKKYLYYLIFFFIFQGVLNYVKVLVFEKFRYSITRDLREHLFKSLLYCKISESESLSPGDVSSRVSNDVTEIEYLLRVFAIQISGSVITFSGSLIIMFFIDFQLTLVALFSILISLMVLFFMAGKFKFYSKRVLDKLGEISDRVQEIVNNFKLIKAYLLEKVQFKKLKSLNLEEFSFQMDRAKYLALFSSVNQMLIWLSLVVIIGLGFYNMSSRKISPGELVSFILYTFKLILPAVGIAMSFSYLNQGLAAWERVKKILSLKGENVSSGICSGKLRGDILFKDVVFGFSEKKVLNGVSFSIKAGEKVGIVGITGSGKSTILNLIVRFYERGGGEIFLDGKRIEDYNINFLRERITYIPQKNYIFSGGIEENVLKGGGEVEDLLDLLTIDEEKKFTDRNISGGEAQRISILRGLLKRGDIFLIDEITSSLDSLTENKVFEILREILAEKTAIIVAHRLSSIKWVDRIIVLDNGVIVEEGSHQHLISKKGIYYHFYLLQKLEKFDLNP